ncbi:uncharacterized protein BDZ99DRAFT_520082 [Mytilinidion resinicola]|uniref:Zn(2)-C6 fungal-type domain-containing protein n=1 Tax=Mytilinidion resinicola TaxID=574789 RepID=A0A6A6YMH1_9PEZI|nr:uncharacterized protein BDZ99DRAFT_520082 [Mytilinidion resinicola]KAF2809990.1 hypothetical protein BDZ99DRAFT_520082 [Mytilinidion resinicola]
MTTTSKGKGKRTKPPVKVACLACRASRIRCDGNSTCANCFIKDVACVYTKSNRGGPRVSRKKAAQRAQLHGQREQQEQFLPFEDLTQLDLASSIDPYRSSYDDIFSDIIMPMIAPGAGLKSLDSDQIFDSIFGNSETESSSENSTSIFNDIHASAEYRLRPRMYGSDKDILNAYYIYIHPFFPVLPPPESVVSMDNPLADSSREFEPSSPLSLAISAILSLIPNCDDSSPQSPDSVLLRRRQSHFFAQLAMESIEIESEILASTTSPAEALSSKPSLFRRDLFHPKTPVELESILAYLLLSGYEYAQRGNLAKMRNRASQALDAATRLSLQEDITGVGDIYREAKRRAWWMTYVSVLQCSIVSSTAPIMAIDHQSFATPLPTIKADPGAWKEFIDAQQMIWRCTEYTISLKRILESGRSPSVLDAQMRALDHELDSLIEGQDLNLDITYCDLVDVDESVLARSLRAQAQIKLQSAKIKLHRYRAFQDAPLFTQKHCDLTERSKFSSINTPPSCCSSSPFSQNPISSPDRMRRTSSASSSEASSPGESPPSDIPSMKRVLSALENYAIAFEAIDGMRGQIQEALEAATTDDGATW